MCDPLIQLNSVLFKNEECNHLKIHSILSLMQSKLSVYRDTCLQYVLINDIYKLILAINVLATVSELELNYI